MKYKTTMHLDKSVTLEDFDVTAITHECVPIEYHRELNRHKFHSDKINNVLAVVNHYKYSIKGKLIIDFNP